MSEGLVPYTNPQSRGRTARWMLEEVGQPYRTEILDYGTTMKGPAYLAINPMGKVPALKHGETVVTEAAAICAYLADAFPQAGLAPPVGDPRRGPYFRWMFFVAGPLEAAWTNKSFGVVLTSDQQRMAGYGSFEAVVDALELAVSGTEYLTGDSFTAADVYVGAGLGFGMQFGMIPPRPALQAYWQRVSSRPAAKRAAEIDDAAAG